ncbi:hypothetical protein QFC22_004411 [Naganishia vaughanmartiniae]|uniref:Uncharacterized protein n=1 Tax=Naganishia vaughanmartiniae TaxID=1424756 RepID=A0ACC2X1R1_9TREE|nr:hypothetical protein QFC22_004411 [Naganishia vaughanmartiniae]
MNKPKRWSHEGDEGAVKPSASEESVDDNDPAVALPSLVPLSHAHPLLDPESTKQWDVDAFLLSRSDLPLDELRTELRQYLASLREELGELINDEYEEFISLSLGLRGEAEQLEDIKLPLQVIKIEVEDIRSTFVTAQGNLETLLHERSSLREEKAILDLLLHLTETLERTENLLGIRRETQNDKDDTLDDDEIEDVSLLEELPNERRGRSTDKLQADLSASGSPSATARPRLTIRTASSSDDLFSMNSNLPKRDIKMLHRIANEYTQLVYLINKAKRENCAYVTVGAEGADVERRVSTLKSTLQSHLAMSFSEIISSLSNNYEPTRPQQTADNRQQEEIKARLLDCLDVYAMIEGWRDAEEVLRRHVKREVSKIVTTDALTRGLQTTLAPGTPTSLLPSTSPNGISPTLSVKTPFTPTLLGSTLSAKDDGMSVSPGNSQGRMSESTNVFEKTLTKQLEESTNQATPVEGYTVGSNTDQRVHSHTGPHVTYLSEDGPGANLAAIYNSLLRYIQHDLQPILQAVETLQGRMKKHQSNRFHLDSESHMSDSVGPSTPVTEQKPFPDGDDETGDEEESNEFQFMSRVVWVEIGGRIISEIGNWVFAAGRVSELHQHYTITHAFLTQLELLSGSIRAVALIRSSEIYSQFGKRWQLPIYFQLRWKEIVVALEDALSSGIGASTGRRDGYALSQSAAAMTAVKACWAPSTYIPELSHRFWRLTLQILSRYQTWLQKAAPVLYDPTAVSSTSNTAGAVSSGRQSSAISRSSTPQPNGNATQSGSDPSSDPAAAVVEDNTLRISSLVAIDLLRLRRDAQNFWSTSISPALIVYLDETDLAQIDSALQESLQGLSSLFSAPSTQIQQILIRRCTDPLKLIRSVASQLRAVPTSATQKEPEPSHFVGNILKPLKEYFANGGPGESVHAEVGEEWSRRILAEVISRKTEELLRRHRKGKKTGFSLFGSSAANAVPTVEEEEQRFKKQMMTDILALAKEAEKLGFAVEDGNKLNVPGWSTLIDVADGKVKHRSLAFCQV